MPVAPPSAAPNAEAVPRSKFTWASVAVRMRSGVLASSSNSACSLLPAASSVRAQKQPQAAASATVRENVRGWVSEKPMQPAAASSGMPACASARQ